MTIANDAHIKKMLHIALFFAAIAIGIQFISRLLILLLLTNTDQHSITAIYQVLLTGLRFDLKLTSTILLATLCLPALCCLAFHRWYLFSQWLTGSLFFSALLLLLLSAVNVGFHFYFGSPINAIAFGILEDGPLAVIASITDNPILVGLTLLTFLLISLLSYLFIGLSKHPKYSDSRHYISRSKIALMLLLSTLLLASFARGSFGTFPLSRKTIKSADDPTLSSLALNASYHLYYAISDRLEDDFSKLHSVDILQQAKVHSLDELLIKAGYSQQQPLYRKTAIKPANFVAPHIIFVLMEGWSTHFAISDSENNNIMGSFSRHADEDHFFRYFFSNAYGTNPTIDTLLINSVITPLSQSTAASYSYSLSNILPFKRQGYRTLFLSGGNSNWRNHNLFWPKQGFDHYIGRATIESFFHNESKSPWGVYEEYLFEYLKLQLVKAEQDKTPSFTFVLTTNNHPPTILPDHHHNPADPMRLWGEESTDDKQSALSSYHYETDSLGQFLTWLKHSSLKDKVIVVATGDHIYKGLTNYSNHKMGYLRYSVPAYFYLPKAYDILENIDPTISGSHQDLFPTLFEAALSGEDYLAFGTPLSEKNSDNAYGAFEDHSYLFNGGIVYHKNTFFSWQDQMHILLNQQGEKPTAYQQQIIAKEQAKQLLKRYLLVNEYEQLSAKTFKPALHQTAYQN